MPVKNIGWILHRIYVCGLSMGGGGTWDYHGCMVNAITAIVPIAGASWPTTAKRGKLLQKIDVAVWAFHNTNDPTVPSMV